ncbi:MAG: hypothetical protein ABJB66_16010, partial [Gemmatimonadaceae bacterium]
MRTVVIAGFILAIAIPSVARAQAKAAVPDTADPLARAMMAEDRHDLKAAAANYRIVLARALNGQTSDGDQADMALLGLERVWAEAGLRDSVIPVVQRVLLIRRTDPVARGIQLRALVASSQDEAARIAFTDWRRANPTDAAPYREYARLLLGIGRAKAADTILTEAARLLGNGRELSGEVGQLNIALERWQPAAVAYRIAVTEQPWMETAALFALQRTPAAMRDSVRAILSAPPVMIAPRRLLSNLELAWTEPRRAWAALSTLTVDDSTIATWRVFGERLEVNDNWPLAREVWTAVMEKRGDMEAVQRSARAALRTGDAEGALALVARGSSNRSGAAIAKAFLPIEVAALGELGRPAEAQKRIDDNAQFIDAGMRADMMKPLVDAWLRTGNLEQARAAAKSADLLDDDETVGWMALYSGDLATARKRLVRVDARRGNQIEVMTVLARTRVTSSPALGAAYLSLAKRDTSRAVAQFVTLADSMGDAAPAFLAAAARIEEARNQKAAFDRALVLWKRIRADFPKSPEAPEASMAWAHSLVRSGDYKGATAQLEAMLVDFSDSAMAPEARRELQRVRALIPPSN